MKRATTPKKGAADVEDGGFSDADLGNFSDVEPLTEDEDEAVAEAAKSYGAWRHLSTAFCVLGATALLLNAWRA